MALLNPPEIRLSVMTLMVAYLAQRRGQRDDLTHLIDTLAPPSLSEDGKHQLDVRVNVTAAVEVRLLARDGDQVMLEDGATAYAKNGATAVARRVRELVMADDLNSASWGSQTGARDLTNALAWFLTFSAAAAPIRMEGVSPSAKEAQEADFGPRHPASRGGSEEDSGGWPISNDTRWGAFQRWACSLGFAWRTPRGRLVPDPTPAIRDIIPEVFGKSKELPARQFIAGLGRVLPVLETGRYRQFVADNWCRPVSDPHRLSPSTTDAIERLVNEGFLSLDDRSDSSRVHRSDGSTFSHVKPGAGR